MLIFMTKEARATLNVGRFESNEIKKSSSFNKLNLFSSLMMGLKPPNLNTFAHLLYPYT
jgi:hypothetical protein